MPEETPRDWSAQAIDAEETRDHHELVSLDARGVRQAPSVRRGLVPSDPDPQERDGLWVLARVLAGEQSPAAFQARDTHGQPRGYQALLTLHASGPEDGKV